MSDTSRPLSKTELHSLFVQLNHELQKNDLQSEAFIVGGAAMALSYDADRVTRDVDGVFQPVQGFREAVETVGNLNELPPDWINDAVKGFLPGQDHASTVVFQGSHLTVATASPQYLLAMKLFAARFERDAQDIITLYEACGFTTVEEGLNLLQSSYPSARLTASHQYFLEDILNQATESELPQPTFPDSPDLGI